MMIYQSLLGWRSQFTNKAMKYLGALSMPKILIKEIKFPSMMNILEFERKNYESALILWKMVHPSPFFHKEDSWHLVWEVKKNLTCKACCVKDGQKSDDTESLNFSGIISRKNIRIIFDFSALNVLHVWDRSFRFHIRNVALVKRAPYGGNSACMYYWIHLRSWRISFVTSHTIQIQMLRCGNLLRMTVLNTLRMICCLIWLYFLLGQTWEDT